MDIEQQDNKLSTATINATLNRIAAAGRNYCYKDPDFRTRFVQALMIISIILLCAAVWSQVLELRLLIDMQQGAFATEEEAATAANSSDIRQGIIGLGLMFLFVITLVFFMMWVHRSNNNIRALTGEPLKFTPGWAVGWFFVPIAFLWKPYEGIKEIWQTSADHCKMSPPSSPALVAYWWTCWLLSNFLGQVTFRLQMRAEELDQMILASSVTLASDAIDIAAYTLAFLMIGKIHSMHQQIAMSCDIEMNVSR